MYRIRRVAATALLCLPATAVGSDAEWEYPRDFPQIEPVTGKAQVWVVDATYGSYRWLPDGGGFYMDSNNGRDFAGLARVDLSEEAVDFLETPAANIEDVALSGDGRILAWTENHDDYPLLQVRDLESGARREVTQLPGGVYALDMARRAAKSPTCASPTRATM